MADSSTGSRVELDPKTLEALRQLRHLTGLGNNVGSSRFRDEPEPSRRRMRKHKKRRKDSSDDDSDLLRRRDDEEILPKWKLGLIVAAMLLCFGLLYPTVFAPIVNSFLGRGQPQPSAHQGHPNQPPMHPTMNRQPGASSRPPPHMHPASAKMPEVQPQGSSRGGMFTWLMPFYTIGVVVFLVYTLFKNKSKKKKRRRGRYDSESEEESEYSYDGDSRQAEPTLGSRKLRSIQQRLRETETAMSRILEQLEGIAQHAHTNSDEAAANAEPSEESATGNSTLSPQQMAEVEERLRELDSLSQLCQEQRNALDDEDVSEEEDRDDSSSSQSGDGDAALSETVDPMLEEYDDIGTVETLCDAEPSSGPPEEPSVPAEPVQVDVKPEVADEYKSARRRRRPKRE